MTSKLPMFVVIAKKEHLTMAVHAAGKEVEVAPTTDDTTQYDMRAMWARVELFKTGDDAQKKAVVAEIYAHYSDMVLRFVRSRVKHEQEAQDIVSITFERMIKSLHRWNFTGRDLGAVLVTIAKNLVADHHKRASNRLEVAVGESMAWEVVDQSPEGNPESAALSLITNKTLREAVEYLNPDQRDCIAYRFLEGLSVQETAVAMGKNAGAIKALQYRATRSLGELLRNYFFITDNK